MAIIVTTGVIISILIVNNIQGESTNTYEILQKQRFVFVQDAYDLKEGSYAGIGFDLKEKNLFVNASTVLKDNKLYGRSGKFNKKEFYEHALNGEITSILSKIKLTPSDIKNSNYMVICSPKSFVNKAYFKEKYPPELEKKLGTNMMVKLTTPDGKVIEKLSGKVFGEGVGNIANFELDKPYLPGETFKYTITSKDYPEVNYEGTFTVPSSLAYNMASSTIFYPFHAGDTYLRVKPQYAVPKGTDALVRVFDEFHGNAYLENNYKVGEIQLPIPKLNQGTTMTAGNKIPVTFMANAYLDNQSSYIVEVPILEKNNQN